MDVVTAELSDFPGFLSLASEVEDWFGPMATVPAFHKALREDITAGNALCVRTDGEAPLLGGLLFGGSAPEYHIGWLVVTRSARRSGIGRSLVRHALDRYVPPLATVDVITFGADHPAAARGGARVFYERLGFTAGQAAPNGPEGGTRQRFHLAVGASEAVFDTEQQRPQ